MVRLPFCYLSCNYETEITRLWFALLQIFKPLFRNNATMRGNQSDYGSHYFDHSGPFFEKVRLWEGINQTMIRDYVSFQAHFLKWWEGINQTSIHNISIIQAHFSKKCDYERKLIRFCGTMIRLSPTMIRIKAGTSDFLQLWFVDARSWVEIVGSKSLVQTVNLTSGRGHLDQLTRGFSLQISLQKYKYHSKYHSKFSNGNLLQR